MSTLRSDIRTEVRDNIAEASGVGGAIWSDALINRHITREIRSLPSKDIYLEQLWTTVLVVDQQDYTLESGTVKIEKLERNDGTASNPDWSEIKGWDLYAGALYLDWKPSKADTIRAHLRKHYAVPTDDLIALEIPDDVCEVIVWGVTVRCFRILLAYLQKSVSWDTVTKPGDLSQPTVLGWYRDAKKYYDELIQQYATSPRPRDIDLVS